MIYIFEDSEHAPISELLKYTLGEDVKFTGGSMALGSFLDKYPNSVCCIDVVQDNKETVKMYKDLKFKYDKRVIPIPCIEYAALLMLADLGIKLPKGMTDVYNIIAGNVIEKYSDKSLEKYLKRILNFNVKRCLHNVSKESNPVYGLFYTSDCTCDSKYSERCVRFDRTTKGDLLIKYTTLHTSSASINTLYSNIGKAIGKSNVTVKY